MDGKAKLPLRPDRPATRPCPSGPRLELPERTLLSRQSLAEDLKGRPGMDRSINVLRDEHTLNHYPPTQY